MPNFTERLQNLRVGTGPQATTAPLQQNQTEQQQVDPQQRLAGLRLGGVDQNQLNQTQGFKSLIDMQANLDTEKQKLRDSFNAPLSQRI